MGKNMIDVGKILNTHGIKGELKVLSLTDNPERFQPGNHVWIYPKGQTPQEVVIQSRRPHQKYELITFVGYEHINDVEPFKHALIKVEHDKVEELEEGQYYYHEIIGCEVYTTRGEKIGVISDIFPTGANDVWTVQSEHGKEFYIPYIDQVVQSIQVDEKKITIEPMEGLLD